MSRWNAPNAANPAWFAVLITRRPACFSEDSWREYVDGVRSQATGDKRLRKTLERGGEPAYCADCTPKHRAAMARQERCHPQPGFSDDVGVE